MNPAVARILHAPSQRFFKTPDNSLMQHAIIVVGELKSKAEAAEDTNEAFWYADAACLMLELALRYDTLRPKEEVPKSEFEPGHWTERDNDY